MNFNSLEEELSKYIAEEIDKEILMRFFIINYEDVGYIRYKDKLYKFPGEYFITDGYVIAYCGIPVDIKDLKIVSKIEIRRKKLRRIVPPIDTFI